MVSKPVSYESDLVEGLEHGTLISMVSNAYDCDFLIFLFMIENQILLRISFSCL